MTFGSRSSPARMTAGSPGSSCCNPKISIETKTSVGRIVATRLTRNSIIASRSSARRRARRSRPHLQACDPQQPVRNAAHSAQLGVVRPQPVAVIEIDDRTILEDARCDQLEGLLALGRSALGTRRVEQLVDLGHAVAGVVERLLAGVEAVEVAVGIGTAAPGEDVGLEVALVG